MAMGRVLCLPHASHTYLPHLPPFLHTAVGKLHIALHRYNASMPPVLALLMFLWCNSGPASFEKAR